MAIAVEVYLNVYEIPDGAGTALLGQNQSNRPGYGPTLAPGAAPAGQSLQLRVSELVPGGDVPTAANFTTVLTTAAADLGTLLSTAGAFSGQPQTPLALIQQWNAGGP